MRAQPRTAGLLATAALLLIAPAGWASPGEVRWFPTATLGLGIGPLEGGEATAIFHSWYGAAWHIEPRGHTTAFVATGLEVDIGSLLIDEQPVATVFQMRPAVRAGGSIYASPRDPLPVVNAYLLAAYHPQSELLERSLRFGIGLSFPMLIPVFAQAGAPNLVEATWDIGVSATYFCLRLGWAI